MLVFIICLPGKQTLTIDIMLCLKTWGKKVNFQQLKIIREAARRDYNLTEVANMLYTSQSGVSRHIRELEEELGIEIFIRRGKRLLGMTEPGKALLSIAERILNEASNVRRLADLFTNDASGVLTIATTHTQARYSLPPVIKAFRELFPRCGWNWCKGRRRKSRRCCTTAGRILVSPASA